MQSVAKSIDTPWGRETGEFHYLGIKPCIIAEMLLEPDSANGLVDYKVWCFNGKPYYIFTGSNRDVITHKVVFNLLLHHGNGLIVSCLNLTAMMYLYKNLLN